MKKLVSLLLTAVLGCSLLLAGCGGGNSGAANSPAPSTPAPASEAPSEGGRHPRPPR